MARDGRPADKFRIEAFDPATHEKASFSCGVAQMDNFLRLSAKKQQKSDFTRIWVAVAPPERRVLGYYAINSHAVEAAELSEQLANRALRHGRIGAAYLSMFAVDKKTQGHGLGRFLLADALKRAAAVANQLGIHAVVLDVLDDGDAEAIKKRGAFYEAAGFIPFPSQPLRMFLPIAVIRQLTDK